MKKLIVLASLMLLTTIPAQASVMEKVKSGAVSAVHVTKAVASKSLDLLVKKPIKAVSKLVAGIATDAGNLIYDAADTTDQFIITL